MESNHAPPAFRADVLTTVLERSVDHSFSFRLMLEEELFEHNKEADLDRSKSCHCNRFLINEQLALI